MSQADLSPTLGHVAHADQTAVAVLSQVLDQHVFPFIRDWASTGAQPRPSGDDIERLARAIENRAAISALPEGYDWLPSLLTRLAVHLRFNSRNYLNIHPTPFVPSIAASVAVSFQNPNNIVPQVSETTTALEQEAIRWLAERLIGFDGEQAWGNVVSGGTIANITALLAARDYTYRRLVRPRPAEVRARGLFGLPTGVVLATAGAHYSIRKALWCLGMGDENVVRIPVAYDHAVARLGERDETFVRGVTDPDWRSRLEAAIAADRDTGKRELAAFYSGAHEPFALQPLASEIYKALYACFTYGTPLIACVFTVGTTDTGTIETLDTAALDLLHREDVYVHVDAAAGGFALLHPDIRKHVRGLDRAESVTIDGHKLGHLAYPNGAVVFRDRGWMYEVLHEAPYLQGLAPTIEGSRPGTHVAALWAAIQALGNGGYEARLDRLLKVVEEMKTAVKESRHLQLLNRVDLTTLAVAPRAEPGTSRLLQNRAVEKVAAEVSVDTNSDAYAINLDRGLADVRVTVDNTTPPDATAKRKDLIDLYCFRLVSANPTATPADARAAIEYLDRRVGAALR